MCAAETLRLIEGDDGVALVEISRPQARNALDVETVAALATVIDRLDGDADIGAIIVTGSDGHFCAGSDIKEMARRGFAGLSDPLRTSGWKRLEAVETPFIAAVDGMALGAGLELALLADFIVCTENARFGFPEVKLGVIPGDGGSQRLPRLIGQNAALRLMLTGEIIIAEEAVRLGIAIAADAGDRAARETGLRLAARIAANAPLATRAVKQTVRRGIDGPLRDGLALEAAALEEMFASEDCAEGMAAFIAKRPAVFTGK
jgi:enoyl-CoA hydratase